MKDYLKEFATLSEYNTYINGTPDLPNVSLVDEDNSVHYTPYVQPTDYSREYLTFEALESGTFTLTMYNYASLAMSSVSYSIDNGETWTTTNMDGTTKTITTPTINNGDKVLWKGLGGTYNQSVSMYSVFSSTGNFNISGNTMSLLYGDNFKNQTSLTNANQQFSGLFKGCTKLISIENIVLPATTLTSYCYNEMFYNCTSLTTAPELPATTLANGCYYAMFKGCTSLTTAPELPATTLANNCYQYMFQVCSSLNNITMLATDISATNCLSNWVASVQTVSGTFTKAASMTTLPSGASGIPANWTVVDAQ